MDEATRRTESSEGNTTAVEVGVPKRARPVLVPLVVAGLGVATFLGAVVLTGSGPKESPAVDPSASLASATGMAPGDTEVPDVPTITLDAEDLLSDGQPVLVVGTGFGAGRDVGVLMCSPHLAPAEGIDRCMTSTFAVARTDSNGRAAIDYRVTRLLTIGDREIDCAGPPPEGSPTSCRLVMGVVGDFAVYAAADVTFDPDGPLQAVSGLEVHPSEGLADRSVASIVIHQPGTAAEWALTQCVTGTTPPVCMPVRIVEPDDPSGAGVLLSTDGSMIVARIEIASEVEGHDCTTAPGVCGIVVRNLQDGRTHAQRLTFEG